MENNNNEDVLQLDIFEIVNILLRYSWIIILSGILCLAATVVYTLTCVAPSYTANLSFYVRNSELQNSISAISTSEINAAIQLATTYKVILQDDSIMEKIGTELIEEFGENRVGEYYTIVENGAGEKTVSAKEIGKQISIEPIDETEILSVTAVTHDPEISAAICENLSQIAPDELKRIVGIDYIESIGSVKIPTEPSGPNAKKNGAIGFGVGFLAAAFIIIVINVLDTKIYDGDFLRDKYQVAVLGEIPYYDISSTVAQR